MVTSAVDLAESRYYSFVQREDSMLHTVVIEFTFMGYKVAVIKIDMILQ